MLLYLNEQAEVTGSVLVYALALGLFVYREFRIADICGPREFTWMQPPLGKWMIAFGLQVHLRRFVLSEAEHAVHPFGGAGVRAGAAVAEVLQDQHRRRRGGAGPPHAVLSGLAIKAT